MDTAVGCDRFVADSVHGPYRFVPLMLQARSSRPPEKVVLASQQLLLAPRGVNRYTPANSPRLFGLSKLALR